MAKFRAPAPPFIPARWHGGAQTPRTIVIHGTVSPCVKGGAQAIAKFFARENNKTSAHYIVDPTAVVQAVGDHTVAFHCGHNQDSIGVELCDPQLGKDSRWSDDNHKAMLKRAATLVAQLCLAYDIPATRIGVGDLKDGKHGICGHVDMSLAFRQSTHVDPGKAFPWRSFMSQVRAEVKRIKTPPKPAPKPAPKPTPRPVPTPAPVPQPSNSSAQVVAAVAVDNLPSDHKLVHAHLLAGEALVDVVTTNIRATPPMLPKNVQKCVDTALAQGASVVAFNEMGGRDLVSLLAKHPEWTAVQAVSKGDRRRAPIAYRADTWEYVDHEIRQFSSRDVATKLGKLAVPSGNRFATILTLRDIATKVVVTFVSYHSIAHVNTGGHFGWTGQGPKVLLALRNKIANPAITVYKQGQQALAHAIREYQLQGYVVGLGDWNFSAQGDLAAIAAGKGEPYGPHLTIRRAGGITVYDTGKLKGGTAGSRGIDYVTISGPTEEKK